MAEGNGLLNRHTLSRRIEGSNPSVSAIFYVFTRWSRSRRGGEMSVLNIGQAHIEGFLSAQHSASRC